MRDLPKELDDFAKGKGKGTIQQPKRPTSTLHTDFCRQINQPIKRLVLDECQVVNKREGAKHIAVKNCYAKATIPLSGTLAHNKWHDLSGVMAFLRGHPIVDHSTILGIFSVNSGDEIDIAGIRLRQRFLLAFTIARPSIVVRFKQCFRWRLQFEVNKDEESEVMKLTARYTKATAAA